MCVADRLRLDPIGIGRHKSFSVLAGEIDQHRARFQQSVGRVQYRRAQLCYPVRCQHVLPAAPGVDQCRLGTGFFGNDLFDLQHVLRAFALGFIRLTNRIDHAFSNRPGQLGRNDALFKQHRGRCHVDATQPVKLILCLGPCAGCILGHGAAQTVGFGLAFCRGLARGIPNIGCVAEARCQSHCQQSQRFQGESFHVDSLLEQNCYEVASLQLELQTQLQTAPGR